jgi:hypothetical protein
MKPFTEQQYNKLDELGGVGMPLRHALLAAGVSDLDLDEAMRDKAACARHRAGALRLAQEVTAAISKEALTGNTSAAKLLLNNQGQGKEPKRDSKWQDDLARTKLYTMVDTYTSVTELFERQRALFEKVEREGRK